MKLCEKTTVMHPYYASVFPYHMNIDIYFIIHLVNNYYGRIYRVLLLFHSLLRV